VKTLESPLLVLAIVAALIVLGPQRLPELGRVIGRTIRMVREGLAGSESEEVREEKTRP
jgi:sec-independent protein translocase protein TatA